MIGWWEWFTAERLVALSGLATLLLAVRTWQHERVHCGQIGHLQALVGELRRLAGIDDDEPAGGAR